MRIRATESGKGWTMHLGAAEDVLLRLDLGRPGQLRVVTDPPYGAKSYPTDVDDGVVVHVLRFLASAKTLAAFGYPELLVRWCVELRRAPDEWVTWWPTNAAVKAGGRAKALPKQSECVAIFGDVPGAKLLTYERSEASKAKPQNAHLGAMARVGDVWTDASPGLAFNAGDRLHPNEKSVAFMMKLLILTSERRDLVVDPFAGAATTGIAALRLRRRFIGIEKDRAHFETAVARLRAEENGSTLEAARAGQAPLFGGAA